MSPFRASADRTATWRRWRCWAPSISCPAALSADVFDRLLDGSVDAAVLPIENSLHGSVAEHYDLLLQHPVRITAESLLRIRFHLIAMPGVALAISAASSRIPWPSRSAAASSPSTASSRPCSFYDTAGSVKHLMELQFRDTAGVAPELAASQYGAQILARGLEDHAENFTRFHLLRRATDVADLEDGAAPPASDSANRQPVACNKMSVAFSIDHRPGTLVAALQLLADAGVDLTKIESRPVPGQPWEYVFYAEFRFAHAAHAEAALCCAPQPTAAWSRSWGATRPPESHATTSAEERPRQPRSYQPSSCFRRPVLGLALSSVPQNIPRKRHLDRSSGQSHRPLRSGERPHLAPAGDAPHLRRAAFRVDPTRMRCCVSGFPPDFLIDPDSRGAPLCR